MSYLNPLWRQFPGWLLQRHLGDGNPAASAAVQVRLTLAVGHNVVQTRRLPQFVQRVTNEVYSAASE
jgi:hypothetical protein